MQMFSPRIMVVWPTSAPATSVIASRGPIGRIPTFSPRSEARGRELAVLNFSVRFHSKASDGVFISRITSASLRRNA